MQAGSRADRVVRVHPSTISRLRRRLDDMGRTEDRPRSGRPRATMAASDRRIRMLHLLGWSECHGMGWHIGYSSNWPPVYARQPQRRSLSGQNSDDIQTPLVRRHRLTFQQHNAGPHVARVCTQVLHAQNIHVLPWSAFPPGLSPIEHLWDLLDRGIRRREPRPATVPQLRLALTQEWMNIPQATITRLVTSMRWRCTAVRNANGRHIRYWGCGKN